MSYDDILIYTQTLDEHVHLVRQVLGKLLAVDLCIKLSKCEFHKTQLDYLGFRTSLEGMKKDPSKGKAVLGWQAPKTHKQLQSLLGFPNFYCQFIPSFTCVALLLRDLLRTKHLPGKLCLGHPKQWTLACQQAFKQLKTLFARDLVLKHPDLTKPFIVQADASDVAVEAVLLQTNEGGTLQPVVTPVRLWEELGMDFIIDLLESQGNMVIWTIIDLFCKQAHFVAYSRLPSARNLVKLFITHIYCLHGMVQRIVSNRGVQFTTKFWCNFQTMTGSSQGLSSAFHPATNGAAERTNTMEQQYLHCYVKHQQLGWLTLLCWSGLQ